MRVALLTRFFNNRNAGIGVYSRNLLKHLLDKGIQTDLYSSNFKSREGYFIYSLLELGLKKLSFDSDVYHALTPIEAIWTPKEKTVTTFHDLIPMLELDKIDTHYAGSKVTKFINKRYFSFAAKRAVDSKRIICNSNQTKERIIEHLDVEESKISVIRMGINPELEPRKEKEYKNASYTLGTLSYLDPRKRIDILIDAFMEIDKEDAELLIPSTGKHEDFLKEKAEGDDRVKFLGYLPEENKANYLSSLDVFVLPSFFEGYGLTIVEAMACKTPVVSLEDALIPSDVQDRTHVVGKGNLSKLLSERDFNYDIEGNYKFAKKHDWEKCAGETIEVYREVRK